MSYRLPTPGPFHVGQVRSGDPYELSEGHPIFCPPPSRAVTAVRRLAALALDSDPAVRNTGVDAGIALSERTLRAADIAVNYEWTGGTWATHAPLVLLCAPGEEGLLDFNKKVDEFLAAGTRYVWVVRLVGRRRVDVYEPGKALRTVHAGDALEAPGVLKNAVPVDALFDSDAAQEVALRNLVQRRGYDSFEDAVRKGAVRGRALGTRQGLLPLQHLFARRLGRPLTEGETATLLARFDTVGPDRLGDVVLDLTPDALAAWLTDPDAR
jgi:hypothetical protein